MPRKHVAKSPENEWIVCKGKYKNNPLAAEVAYIAVAETEEARQELDKYVNIHGLSAYRLSHYGKYFTGRGINLGKAKRKTISCRDSP